MAEPKQDTTPQDPPAGEPQLDTGADEKFTQAELNRIVAERLNRERAKYADYEALQEKAAKWAEHEEAQKSELERATARAEAAESERDQARAAAAVTTIRAAFVAEAAKAGAAHPGDAYALADRSGVKLEDGQVAGVTEAVAALVEAGRLPTSDRPRAPQLDGGAGGDGSPTSRPLSSEESEIARRMGVKPEDYQAAKRNIAAKRR